MRFDSATADRVTAAVFFGLGAAMAWGGFVMDRLEIRQIHPASIPGLVPMFLGAALMLCAVLLAVGADRTEREEDEGGASWSDFAVAAVWSCVFAVVLVTRIPFAVATAIYIAGFSTWFLWPATDPGPGRTKMILLVVIFACVAATAVSVLFRYGFLVRLP